MEIAQEKRGAVSVLAPVGRLDTDSAADLELCVHDVLGTGIKHFVVDLAQINYVSSAGLRVLLMLAKSVDGKGSLRVSGLNPQVQQVFDIAGFTKLFAIHPDRESALRDHPAVGEPDPAPAPAAPPRAERAERAPATPPPAKPETPAAAASAPVPAPMPAPVAPPRAAAPAEPPAPRASAPVEPAVAPAPSAPPPRAPVVPGVAEHAARLLGATAAPVEPIDPAANAIGRHAVLLFGAKLETSGAKRSTTPAPAPRAAASRQPVVAEEAPAEKEGFFTRLFGKRKKTL